MITKKAIGIVIIGVIVCAGVFTVGHRFGKPKVSELEELTLPLTTTDGWIQLYGDSEKSHIYYNLTVMTAALNQHAKMINENRKSQPSTQPFIGPLP